jgi:hypothetical protein
MAWVVPVGKLRSMAEPSFERPPFTAQSYSASANEAWRSGGVVLGDGAPNLVVLGSSHAIMYGATVAELARERDLTVVYLCLGNAFGRFYSEGDEAIYRDGMADQRAEFDAARIRVLAERKPQQVLWFGRWENQYEILGPSEFERVMRASLDLVLGHAEQVVLTTQTPFSMRRPGSVVRFSTRRAAQSRPVLGEEAAERRELRRAANNMLRNLAAENPRVVVVEAAELFEMEGGGVRLLSEDGRLLYHDDNHLSDVGAALAREKIGEGMRSTPFLPSPPPSTAPASSPAQK